MIRLMKRLAAVWVFLVFAASIGAAEVEMKAEIGYDGVTLGGRWYPLEIQMKNGEQPISGLLTVKLMQNQDEYDQVQYPVEMESGETCTVSFPVTTMIPQRVFEISLFADGQIVAQTSVSAQKSVADDALLIGVLGDEQRLAQGMSVSSRLNAVGRMETITAICIPEDSFPQNEAQLNAFQILAADGFDLSGLSEEKTQLLLAWVRRGGTLLVSARHHAAWLGEHAGIRVGQEGVSSSLMKSLYRLTETAYTGDDVETTISLMDAGGASDVKDEAGNPLLIQVSCGDGVILAAAFSLSDPVVLSHAREKALWQRILYALDQERYAAYFSDHRIANYRYGGALNEQQLVSINVSVMPVVIALFIYVMVVGCGLFIVLRRRDRSTMLWLYLPAAAMVGVLAVIAFSAALALNEPASASFRITHYRADGTVEAEERALVAYADQDRVVISAEDGRSVERTNYGYFYSGAEEADDAELRDVINLGDAQSIALKPAAPWQQRSLVVGIDAAPEGIVSGTAWMEADGLHAEIENGTDTVLRGAMLFTSLGYVSLGDIPAGETRAAHIADTETIPKTKDGEPAILDGVLLDFPVSLYEAVRASVYLEEQMPDYEENGYSEAERNRLAVERLKRNFVSGSTSDAYFACAVYAETPELVCSQLYKDGIAIARSAGESVLTADLSFERTGRNGYFYDPLGALPVHDASVEQGRPVMGDIAQERYAADVTEDVYFGFDLSPLGKAQIETIRFMADYFSDDDAPLYLEVYDCSLEDWVRLNAPDRCEVDSALASRIVDQNGHLFIRYTADGARHGGTVYLPQIIVEGRETE